MANEDPVLDESFADTLLAGGPGQENDVLRAALLRRTMQRLRGRRRLRYAARFGLLAAFFLGGMGAMATIGSPRPETRIVTVAVPVERVQPKSDGVAKRPPTPAELELRAESTFVKAESARYFREAGDRYLRELADYQAALRCYRNYLDEADMADLAVTQSDTWLLTSLKNSRRKEIDNANADN